MNRKNSLYALLLLLCLPFVMLGCSKSESVEGPAGPPPAGAPIDNNSPAAKNAPAASGPPPGTPGPGQSFVPGAAGGKKGAR